MITLSVITLSGFHYLFIMKINLNNLYILPKQTTEPSQNIPFFITYGRGEGSEHQISLLRQAIFFHYIKSPFLVDHYYDITTSKMAF
jgi:hypothetical protein